MAITEVLVERIPWDEAMRDVDRLLDKAGTFYSSVREIKDRLMEMGPESYKRASDETILALTDGVNEAWRNLDQEV